MKSELIKRGFKEKWFNDHSSSWFNKKIKYNDLKLNIYIQFKPDVLAVQVKTGEYFSNKLTMNKYYDDVKIYKLTLKNVDKLIKKYK